MVASRVLDDFGHCARVAVATKASFLKVDFLFALATGFAVEDFGQCSLPSTHGEESGLARDRGTASEPAGAALFRLCEWSVAFVFHCIAPFCLV